MVRWVRLRLEGTLGAGCGSAVVVLCTFGVLLLLFVYCYC